MTKNRSLNHRSHGRTFKLHPRSPRKTLSKTTESETQTPVTIPSPDCPASEVQAWLGKHPRFKLHCTPTSASWMNLVERFFGPRSPQNASDSGAIPASTNPRTRSTTTSSSATPSTPLSLIPMRGASEDALRILLGKCASARADTPSLRLLRAAAQFFPRLWTIPAPCP